MQAAGPRARQRRPRGQPVSCGSAAPAVRSRWGRAPGRIWPRRGHRVRPQQLAPLPTGAGFLPALPPPPPRPRPADATKAAATRGRAAAPSPAGAVPTAPARPAPASHLEASRPEHAARPAEPPLLHRGTPPPPRGPVHRSSVPRRGPAQVGRGGVPAAQPQPRTDCSRPPPPSRRRLSGPARLTRPPTPPRAASRDAGAAGASPPGAPPPSQAEPSHKHHEFIVCGPGRSTCPAASASARGRGKGVAGQGGGGGRAGGAGAVPGHGRETNPSPGAPSSSAWAGVPLHRGQRGHVNPEQQG